MQLLTALSVLALIPAVLSCQPGMEKYVEQIQRDYPQKCMQCRPLQLINNCLVEGKPISPCYEAVAQYSATGPFRSNLCGTVTVRCSVPPGGSPAALAAPKQAFQPTPCQAGIPDVVTTTTPAPPCLNFLNTRDFGLTSYNINGKPIIDFHDAPKNKPCKNKAPIDLATTEATTTTTTTEAATTTTEEPCEEEEEEVEGSGEGVQTYPGENTLKEDQVNTFFSESTAARKKRDVIPDLTRRPYEGPQTDIPYSDRLYLTGPDYYAAFLTLTCNEKGQWMTEERFGSKVIGVPALYCVQYLA